MTSFDIVLVFLVLAFNIFHNFFCGLCCWLNKEMFAGESVNNNKDIKLIRGVSKILGIKYFIIS